MPKTVSDVHLQVQVASTPEAAGSLRCYLRCHLLSGRAAVGGSRSRSVPECGHRLLRPTVLQFLAPCSDVWSLWV